MRQLKKEPLYKSFSYAFEGIFAGIRKERNMKIHCVAAIGVTAAGILFHISALEWCICLVLFGIEAVVDLVTEEKRPLAKLAKDTAAGAVLIAALMAAAAGLMIFLPKLLQLFSL